MKKETGKKTTVKKKSTYKPKPKPAKKLGKDNNGLSQRQKDFCRYYVETSNATESYKRAGYKCTTENTAYSSSSNLLRNAKVQAEIARLLKPKEKAEEKHIATAQEVMQFFTDMMAGKIKDQFGLDASNADRIKAAQEIAKRTVDIDNRKAGVGDNTINIKIDWRRDNGDSEQS